MQKDAYTVDEFCQLNSISRRTYYNMKSDGTGPREMLVGTHPRISREAAEAWRREREQAALVAIKALEAV